MARKKLDRRSFIGGVVGAAGVTACALAGCRKSGQGEPAGASTATPRPEPRTASATSAATPSAAEGGAGAGDRPVTVLSHRRPSSSAADLVVCAGTDPYAQTLKALEALGGIGLVVRPGDTVIISPNLAWARTPEQAANTNPRVLRAAIDACVKAGAKKITVLDYVLDPAPVAFRRNGAQEAVKGTPATLISPEERSLYRAVDVSALKTHVANGISQAVPKALLEAQVLISVPVIKDHGSAIISGALKKAMGLIWERKAYHSAGLHECIAEINTIVRPSLVIADATRVMQTRGPKGPGEVSTPQQVLVGGDPVVVDAYACRYLKKNGTLKPADVRHIVQAATLLGTTRHLKPKLLEVTA